MENRKKTEEVNTAKSCLKKKEEREKPMNQGKLNSYI